MSKKKDQFSVDSVTLATNLTTLVTYSATAAVATRLGISAADNTELSGVVTPFVTAQAALSNKNAVTKTLTQTRDTAQEKAVAVARRFSLKWYYNNLPATATDVLNAALEPHSDVRTKLKGGTIELPRMAVESQTGHQFNILMADSLGSRGRPVNVVFFRVRYFVVVAGTTAPVDPADFCKFIDNSSYPIVLTLPAAQAGLPIAIASCYVDAQGNEGPYTTVVNTNIT